MNFRLTTHAIRRYQQRIDRCQTRDAIDRLRHAAEISRLATAKEIYEITSHNGQRRGRTSGLMFRYCPVESLVLTCRRMADHLLVVTVFRFDKRAA